MVEFFEVAELVHDYVVCNTRWQSDDAVVEIEISFFRTTSPTRLLVADEDLADRAAVGAIEMRDAFEYKGARLPPPLLAVAHPGSHGGGSSIPNATASNAAAISVLLVSGD